jgi:hypothetical protein
MVVTDVYRGRLFYYYLWRRLKPKRQYVSKKRRKKPYDAAFLAKGEDLVQYPQLAAHVSNIRAITNLN